jgi:hypothetical protein
MSLCFDKIPEDMIACILEYTLSRKDLYHCALVNHTFYDAAVPRLYRTLDNKLSKLVSFCTMF